METLKPATQLGSIPGKILFCAACACLLPFAQGQTIRPQPRTSATTDGIHLYPFRSPVSGNIGYIDEKGNIKIRPEITDCGTIDPGPEFAEGRAVAGCSPFGYVDASGSKAIEAKFDAARAFSQGFAAAQSEDGKWGFINNEGKFVIGPKFDDAGDFSEGLAPVNDGDLWGYIDASGQVKIPFSYEKAGSFSEGIAPVRVGKEFGYIDKAGKPVIQPQFKDARSFHEDVAAVLTDSWHFINRAAHPAFPGTFQAAGDFANQLAPAMSTNNSVYGYIDHAGKFIIPPEFEQANAFKNGLALVYTKTQRGPGASKKRVLFYSYIDKSGNKMFSGEILYLEIWDKRGGGSKPHFSIPMSPVTVTSEPPGAKVYMIPLDEWESDKTIERQNEKLLRYLQTQYTPLEDYPVIQQVYRVILDWKGQRVARYFDVNEGGPKRLEIDFHKEQ